MSQLGGSSFASFPEKGACIPAAYHFLFLLSLSLSLYISLTASLFASLSVLSVLISGIIFVLCLFLPFGHLTSLNLSFLAVFDLGGGGGVLLLWFGFWEV